MYIGVDPGSKGAVAFIWPDQAAVHDFENMEALTALMFVAGMNEKCAAMVEKVHSGHGQGVKSVFTFGKATGRVIGWLEGLSIPYEEVTPAKWKKAMFDSGGKTGDLKADSLNMARKLFPSMLGQLRFKKNHDRAEALLIAEYCKRVKEGKNG